MSKEITIKDENGKPIWYAKVENDHVSLEFEAFADAPGAGSVETIYEIAQEKYQEILDKFELGDIPIGKALREISDRGFGKDFVIWSIDNQIAVKSFTWISFGD